MNSINAAFTHTHHNGHQPYAPFCTFPRSSFIGVSSIGESEGNESKRDPQKHWHPDTPPHHTICPVEVLWPEHHCTSFLSVMSISVSSLPELWLATLLKDRVHAPVILVAHRADPYTVTLMAANACARLRSQSRKEKNRTGSTSRQWESEGEVTEMSSEW